jgi:rod shape-determining protein MreC
VLSLGALLLIGGYLRSEWLREIEARLSVIATPLYWLADLPSRAGIWGEHNLRDWRNMAQHNEQLRQENLILQAKVARMAALAAENARLRQLLNSATLVEDSVLVAEITGVSPDPLRHLVVIDKGAQAGAFIGQAVIDANGLAGQVVEASPWFSRVLLITDTTHALPVQVNRNGVRAIAEGSGRIDELELVNVAATTDIKVGDLLVTSGLGGRFPAGYPVAVVSEVTEASGEPFVRVRAQPTARLDQSRHLLLIFPESRVEATPPADPVEATP